MDGTPAWHRRLFVQSVARHTYDAPLAGGLPGGRRAIDTGVIEVVPFVVEKIELHLLLRELQRGKASVVVRVLERRQLGILLGQTAGDGRRLGEAGRGRRREGNQCQRTNESASGGGGGRKDPSSPWSRRR